MTKYVVCYSGDIDAKPPQEIEHASIGGIDLLKRKTTFKEAVNTFYGNSHDVKFFIASRSNFYHVFDALIQAGIPYDRLIKPEPLTRDLSIAGMPYSMREELLTNPSAPINRVVAKDNLLLFKNILESAELKFFLAYGTLLGAVREGDFIAHDSDVDVGMYATDKSKFLPLLFTLKKQGLELVRFDPSIVSLMRNGEYMDIYFFEKKLFPKVGWHCAGLYMPTNYIKKLDVIEFHGHSFLVPSNYLNLLVFLYGKHWREPIKNSHAKPLFSIKSFLLKLVPISLKASIKKYLTD